MSPESGRRSALATLLQTVRMAPKCALPHWRLALLYRDLHQDEFANQEAHEALKFGYRFQPAGSILFRYGRTAQNLRLVIGLEHPWSLAFLPDGNMLITKRPGRIRIVRDGVLNPKPVATP